MNAGTTSTPAEKPAEKASSSQPQNSGTVTPLKPAATTAAPTLKNKAPKAAKKKASAKVKKTSPKNSAAKSAPKAKTMKKTSVKAKNTAKSTFAPSAKSAISKATQQPRKGTEYTRDTTQKAMEMGADKMKKAFTESARETQKAQDQFMQFSRETADQFAKATDSATRSLTEAAEQSRYSMEALVESGNITADMTRSFTNEIFRFANESFSDNIEISKEIFGCKTINDVYDMQNKMVRNNLDHFFNQSSRFSDMMFQYMTDAAEPFNQRMSATGKNFGKKFKY